MRAVRGCLLSCLVLILSAVLICQSSPVQRGYVDSGDFGSLRSKKPFCNAFTGCGRKRSDPAMAAATAGFAGDNGQIDQIVADKIRRDVDQIGDTVGGSGTNVNLWPQLSMRFGSTARYRGEGSGNQFGF